MVVAQDGASQVLRGISSSFGGIGTAIQSITGGRLLETFTASIVKFGKDSVEATVNYANEVRGLMLVSGESAENTGRFIQVLDDFKLSTQDAMTATRALTKQGLAPNIDTLAKLSDEYIALNSVEAKNEFIMKNLGRAGFQWAEMLGKGSRALREQADAIDDGLIPTQEALDKAREYELALDDWNDAVLALKVSIGNELLPTLVKMTQGMTHTNEIRKEANRLLTEGLAGNREEALMMASKSVQTELAAKAALNHTAALDSNSEAAVDNASAIKAAEEAVKKLSEANTDYLSSIGSLSDENKDFEKQNQDIIRQQFELRQSMNRLIAEGIDPLSEEYRDLESQYDSLSQKTAELARAKEDASRRMILSMLQEQLAIDGLETKEMNYLIRLGVQWGVYSETAIAEMEEAQREVAALVGQYNNIPSQISTQIVTSYVTLGTPIGNFQSGDRGGGMYSGMAGGGGVNIGQMYRVNETRKEFFKPSMSGEVIPLGGGKGGGGGQGITVVLQPMIMTADRSSINNVLLPAILEGIRKAKTDGII